MSVLLEEWLQNERSKKFTFYPYLGSSCIVLVPAFLFRNLCIIHFQSI